MSTTATPSTAADSARERRDDFVVVVIPAAAMLAAVTALLLSRTVPGVLDPTPVIGSVYVPGKGLSYYVTVLGGIVFYAWTNPLRRSRVRGARRVAVVAFMVVVFALASLGFLANPSS